MTALEAFFDIDAELDRVLGESKLERPVIRRDGYGRFVRPPGGEWDWFYDLPDSDRRYVQRHYMADTGVRPDEVATWLSCSVDEAMEAVVWLVRARRHPDIEQVECPSSYDDEMQRAEVAKELVGPAEVAAMLGVKVNTIAQMRHRGQMLEPLTTVTKIAVWFRSDIEAWMADRKRQKDARRPAAQRSEVPALDPQQVEWDARRSQQT